MSCSWKCWPYFRKRDFSSSVLIGYNGPMSQEPDKPQRPFQLSFRRILFWVFPLVSVSMSIASCRIDDLTGHAGDRLSNFVAAKAVAIGVISVIWCILVWEDRRAILRHRDDA